MDLVVRVPGSDPVVGLGRVKGHDMSGVIVFSKIDMRGSYHRIRIRLGDGWRTTFKTRDDHSKLQ